MADIHAVGASPGTRKPRRPARGRSLPVRLEIPAIELTADVTPIGLGADGNLDVPPPSRDATVWWYQGSPTPGETGSAVIVGHLELRLLRPTDGITVGRADGSRITFVVTGVAVYPNDHFPGHRMAGPRDYPALTLLTSGDAGRIVFARRDPAG